jgi:16S rRNA (guanine527-N7)-methyltransferase
MEEMNSAFDQYVALLRDWNERINLVASSTLGDIRGRHIEDSIQLADFIPKDSVLVDLGSGAGFPGVVLVILGYTVTCTESIGKKAGFLTEVKKKLGLNNLTVYHGRIEDFVRENHKNTGIRPVFTARAFAPLIKILDLTYPIKGRYFLLKGRRAPEEIAQAQTQYKFDYQTSPSRTGDGCILEIDNVRRIRSNELFHVK